MTTPKSLIAQSLGGLPVQLDPLLRDYDSFRSALIELANRLTPEWTDFFDGDPGVVLLEAMSYVAGVQSYMLDRVQNESYLLTAQQRSSVIKLLRLINYELSPPAVASCPITITTDQPNVLLEANVFTVSSEETAESPAISFQIIEDVVIPLAGTYTVDDISGLVVYEGESIIGEVVATSDGEANQSYALQEEGVALGVGAPLNVYVNSVEWTRKLTFLESEPTDEHYKIEIDEDGVVTIIFGDGINGKIPPSGQDITADYRIGGGDEGNSVGIGTLTDFTPAVAGVVSVTNTVQPSGGKPAETIDEAKQQGPLTLRALDRAVTLEDFETLAKQVSGVRAARAAHVNGPFEVNVYVAASGSNPVPSGKWYPELDAGTGLLGGVGRYLSERKVVPTQLHVEAPTIVRPYLEAEVIVLPNILRSDVEFEIKTNLSEYFTSLLDQFGVGVPLSRIHQIIENTRGVDFANILAFHRQSNMRRVYGFEDSFDAATFSIPTVYPQSVYDVYTIEWVSATSYRLVGESYGPIVDSLGNVRTFSSGTQYKISHFPFSSDPTIPDELAQFEILVAAGVPAPSNTARWVFGIDNYRGNIALSPYDILAATIYTNGDLDPTEVVLRLGGGIG